MTLSDVMVITAGLTIVVEDSAVLLEWSTVVVNVL
jgi:phosphoserine phosphatase